MTKDEDFKLLKIQTCVLRVNIHCDGCHQKVKKLLNRIKGVYQVSVDSEQQKVTVSGSVDSDTLIKKLGRAGKHAELWSSKPNQTQKQKNSNNRDDQRNSIGKVNGQKQGLNLMKGLEAFKNQQNHKFAAFDCEDDDECDEDDDEEDEDELRFLREKVNQLGLLRQQAMEAANEGKKAQNNPKINNGGNGRKPNLNQTNMDPKSTAAMKLGEARRNNDLTAMMNLAGFHGNAPSNNNVGSSMPVNNGSFQMQQTNNGFGQQYSPPVNGNHHQSQMMNMMNLQQQRQAMMMNQPQVMYQRSPHVPANTGFYHHNINMNMNMNNPYYDYYPAQAQPYDDPRYASDGSASHMFSDDNTSGCSIM